MQVKNIQEVGIFRQNNRISFSRRLKNRQIFGISQTQFPDRLSWNTKSLCNPFRQ